MSKDQQAIVTAENLLEGANQRIRFQHEFSLAGFRTLILINGGAIIGLLTYIGNVEHSGSAAGLKTAFACYVVGLSLTMLAYLFAYYSQGAFMSFEMREAYRLLGNEFDDEDAMDRRVKSSVDRGNWSIVAGVVLTVGSLIAFLAGSWFAMAALA